MRSAAARSPCRCSASPSLNLDCRAAAPFAIAVGKRLLRQQLIGAVPVVRWRVSLVADEARFVEIVEIFERIDLVGLAAALDRGERAVPVAIAVAGQHLDREIAQALELFGLRDVL